MRYLKVIFFFLVGLNQSFSQNDLLSLASANQFNMATPKVAVDSILFFQRAEVKCEMGFVDADIMYRKNQGEWKEYIQPLFFEESGMLEIKSVHPELNESEIVSEAVFKIGHRLTEAEIEISPKPSKKYAGEGARSLIDLKIGNSDFRTGNYWLGVQADTFEIDLDFKKNLSFQSVTLSSLRNQGAWIFFPEQILVFTEDDLVVEKRIADASVAQKNKREFISLDFHTLSTDKLSIKIISLPALPDWHPGAGGKPWFFVDEILIN